MKQTICTFTFLFLCIFYFNANAQTKEHPISITGGGGFENYKGDLGNTFFDFEEEVYGFVRFGFSHYLTKSFDAQLIASTGNYGHCRDAEDAITDLNMRSLLTTGIVHIKYKFANGYLLKEHAKLAPYIYAGGGINHLYNFDSYNRVNAGFYFSYNAGFGCNYNITPDIYLGYNIALGWFTSDKLDYQVKGGNDSYMQNSLSVGFNFSKLNCRKKAVAPMNHVAKEKK